MSIKTQRHGANTCATIPSEGLFQLKLDNVLVLCDIQYTAIYMIRDVTECFYRIQIVKHQVAGILHKRYLAMITAKAFAAITTMGINIAAAGFTTPTPEQYIYDP